MAAKLLDVSFLGFPLHPFVMGKQSLLYVNLTLILILVILYSSFMYFLFSRRASQISIIGAESHGN